jgi:hypothetical protein
MATKKVEMQRFARWYREKVGYDASMQEVALAAKAAGWPMPKPKDPIDLLAKAFAEAEREEMRYDEVLGASYNANICYQVQKGDKQITLWGDTDKADLNKIEKNKTLRRDQVVGDLLQIKINLLHWNRINPDQKPVDIELDFTPDIEWKLNAPKEGNQAA